MRALLAIAASVLLPLAAAGATPPAGAPYLPPALLGNAEDNDMFNRWLGRELAAMDEPALLGVDLPRDVVRRFRMVTTVNHRGSYAVRVDQLRGGGARVRAVELGGAGRVPRIVRAQSYDIDRHDVLELGRAVHLSRLERLEATGPPPGAGPPPGDDMQMICIPSAQFFFELVDARHSRFVERSGCELTPGLSRLLKTLHPLRALRR